MGLFRRIFNSKSSKVEVTTENFLEVFRKFFKEIYKYFFEQEIVYLHTKIRKLENVVEQLKKNDNMLYIEIEKLKALHSITTPPIDTEAVYPPSEEIDSITWVWNEPSGEPEDYLTPFTDTLNGSTVIRIGDTSMGGGAVDQQVGTLYSKVQPWNCDETLIMLGDKSPNGAPILNASNYNFNKWLDLPPEPRWSNLNPKLIYGTSGNEFVVVNYDTEVRSTVHTFASYDNVSMGYNEGNIDQNDKYVALIAETATQRFIVVYDIQLDSIFATMEIDNSADLDWASVSIRGEYVLLQWRPDGVGNEQGLWCYDIDLTNGKQLYYSTQHGDCCIDQNGDEVYVQFRNGDDIGDDGYFLVMTRLSDGADELMFYDTGSPKGIYGGHISGRNFNRPGWAYVSETCCANSAGVPNENFALKLDWDGDNEIQRFGFNYGSRPGGATEDEVRACPNRDGTKIIFNSFYYDTTLESLSYPPAWVMEYPQN